MAHAPPIVLRHVVPPWQSAVTSQFGQQSRPPPVRSIGHAYPVGHSSAVVQPCMQKVAPPAKPTQRSPTVVLHTALPPAPANAPAGIIAWLVVPARRPT